MFIIIGTVWFEVSAGVVCFTVLTTVLVAAAAAGFLGTADAAFGTS